MAEKLTVEAGKCYNRRDGEISGVIKNSKDGSTHPYHDDNLYWYNSEGKNVVEHVGDYTDLISEYKEPTAEPQDEWGPWIGWNGGRERPASGGTVVEIVQSNGNRKVTRGDLLQWQHPDNSEWSVIAYRIKKEPEVRECFLYLNENCKWQPFSGGPNVQKAIITLTNGKLSIRWAEEWEAK